MVTEQFPWGKGANSEETLLSMCRGAQMQTASGVEISQGSELRDQVGEGGRGFLVPAPINGNPGTRPLCAMVGLGFEVGSGNSTTPSCCCLLVS